MVNPLISYEALCQAAMIMRGQLGDLNDLPVELQNTLANIYYRFFAIQEDMLSRGQSGLLDTYLPPPKNHRDHFKLYTDFQALTLAYFGNAKGLVNAAREAGAKSRELFSYLNTMTLDVFKYNIDDAGSKSPIRRAIERKFKTVYEIPNLIGLMRKASASEGSITTGKEVQTSEKEDSKTIISCPSCSQELRVEPGKIQTIVCFNCDHIFKVQIDETTPKVLP